METQSASPQPITKICNTCGRELPITMFYKNNQRRDGHTGRCADCTKVRRKEYDHKYNRTEKARENARRYYYSEKGQKVKKEYRVAYLDAHKDDPEWRDHMRSLWKKYNRQERYKGLQATYWQTEKGKKVKAKKDARYQRTPLGRMAKKRTEKRRKYNLASTENTLTLSEWEEIKARYDYRCAYCLKKPRRLEMDHIIPLSKGGTHTKENIVPACRTCNAKKGNKLPTE